MKYIILLLGFLFPLCLQAQDITGKVMDPTGNPVEGATITLKQNGEATITDPSGGFRLKAPTAQDSLVITHVQYERQSVFISLPSISFYEITLYPSKNVLSEVEVSTGYEVRNMKSATGAFDVIDNKLLNRQVSTNIISRLEGTVPGLAFNKTRNEGDVISIRGRSTILSNDQPLIVVDNFPYEGSIENINPNDIESVTILKDAAAASIWGARAGNGVIVITTKKPNLNRRPVIQLNSNFSFGTRPDYYYQKTAKSEDFVEMERMLFDKGLYNSKINNKTTYPSLTPAVLIMLANRNGEVSTSEMERELDSLKKIDNRDDLSGLLRNTFAQNYGLSISGGTVKHAYYLFVGFDKAVGATKEENQRLNLRAENDFVPVGTLKIKTGVSFTSSEEKGPGVTRFVSNVPYMRLIDDDRQPLTAQGKYRQEFVYDLMEKGFMDWAQRPAEDITLQKITNGGTDVRLTVSAIQPFLKHLTANVSYQYQNQQGISSNYYGPDSYFVRDLYNTFTQIDPVTNVAVSHPVPEGGILNENISGTRSNNGRGQINFNLNRGDYHISALAGAEFREVVSGGNSVRYYGYDPGMMLSKNVDFVNRYTTFPSRISQNIPGSPSRNPDVIDRFRSYFSNAYFTYKKLYTISASARKDESNLFGVNTNQRGIPLWSAGLKYNVSGAKFYNLEWLPSLQIRTTYGINGNINKSLTAFTTVVMSTNKYNQMSAELQNPPNPDLRWESSGILNVALDFALKNQRLSGTLDLYWKHAYDLIGLTSIDPTTGVANFQGNVANMKGKGIDLQLKAVNIQGPVNWITTCNFSYTADEVTKYNKPAFASDLLNQAISPIIGKPVYGIYAYRWGGLDENGNPQGYVDSEPSTEYSKISALGVDGLIYIGPARAPYFGNLLNMISYKSFSISANILYKAGYKFRLPSVSYSTSFNQNLVHSDYALRWQKPGDELHTNVPSLIYPANVNRDNFYGFSEVLVESGSQIRLQDVRFDYIITGNNKYFHQIGIYAYASQLGILWRANEKQIDPNFISTIPGPVSFSFGVNAHFK